MTERHVEGVKETSMSAMKTYAGILTVDSATVHKEPYTNFCLKIVTIPKPLQLELINAKDQIAEEGTRTSDFTAKRCVAVIKKTPDDGLHIVLIVQDTASDECLMAKMVITQCPWISDAPCSTHIIHLYHKDMGEVEEVKKRFAECAEVTEFMLHKHLTVALLDKYVPIHYPNLKEFRPKFAPDARFGAHVLSELTQLEL